MLKPGGNKPRPKSSEKEIPNPKPITPPAPQPAVKVFTPTIAQIEEDAKIYTHLEILPVVCKSIISAVNELLREQAPKRALFKSAEHTLGDKSSHDAIFESYLVNAVEFGYTLGFGSYQLAVWLTIFLQTQNDTINGMRHKNFSAAQYSEIFQKNFFNMIQKPDPLNPHTGIYTEAECMSIMEYMLTGFAQHLKLFKFIARKSQDFDVYKISKWIDIKTTPPHPLQMGIPAEKWEDYCKAEEEKIRIKRIQEETQREKEKIRQLELQKEKEAHEYTASLKAQQAEAERQLLLPLPPYPVSPPAFPTKQTLFRKPIQPKTPSRQSSAASIPSNTKSSQNLADLTIQAPLPANLGDLLPPPDVRCLKPLEKLRKLKLMKKEAELTNTSIVVSEAIEPVKEVEYEYIPLEQTLSREEASQIIANSAATAIDERKRWVLGLLEYENKMWNERFQTIQKIKELREEDRLATIQREQQEKLAREEEKKRSEAEQSKDRRKGKK
ncbi:hypothetical protein HDV01_000580 [Terramyces sp. JEL0728]|nr:hypothetical protein HDV01_000580 [Terramyces sp. JEL0728]